MEKYTVAYKYTPQEVEELLQYCLDDKGIKLVNKGHFYYAESDTNFLDGSEIDERMAQILNVKECEPYATKENIWGKITESVIVLVK